MRNAILGLSTWLLLAPSFARAQGFGVYEQGTCVMSRGGAGVADPCGDGSAVYVNPAGLMGGRFGAVADLERPRWVLGGGGTLIIGTGSFTDDLGLTTKLRNTVTFPPHVYFQQRINDRTAWGLGVYVPYGLGVKWPIGFAGRFVSYDARLSSFYIQPTLAHTFGGVLSVGGGLTVAVGSVELNRREDLARVPLGSVPGLTFGALVDSQTDFLDTNLQASGAIGTGANLGVLVKAGSRLRVGARYLSQVKLDYDGNARFTPIAANYVVTKPNPLGLPVGTPLDSFVSQAQAQFQNQPASTRLTMPAQFVVGVKVQAAEAIGVLADYQWVGWSVFDEVTLDFTLPVPPTETLVQNYRDTNAVRLGLEFTLSPTLQLRGGYFANQAAAPDETVTPLLPEAKRQHFTAGIGWTPRANFTLDAAYQYVHHADRRGRVVNPPAGEPPTLALNSGVYRSQGNLLGITLTYRRP